MSAMDAPSTPGEPARHSAIDRLVDEYRLRCLWFLRPDYYPSTDAERIQVLLYIERHGDRDAYRRAREMRRWLSPTSSARSAVS
jgi:hypothetical protein